MTHTNKVLAAFAMMGLVAGVTYSQEPPQHASTQKEIKITPDELKWMPGPMALPSGVQVAVLLGDLGKAEPFTVRIKAPDGYRLPPHFHPTDEAITVLKGTLMMGSGDHFDRSKTVPLTAGSFYMLPKGHHHYVWTKGETVLQLHAMGPFGITYVNPSDDPRHK
jgi:mannose-6-phosphate isomerase-like protein (cupin superfamily)